MSEQRHLWDAKHDYYCNEGNYYANGCVSEHRTWASFMEDEGDSDLDYNLVFRWDWQVPTDDAELPIHHPDPNYRDGTLKLFFMGQRKGAYRSVLVSVCRADELSVREWLMRRWVHLRGLWAPLSDSAE